LRASRGIPNNIGGLVVEEAGGLAAKAGVQAGDIVVGLNGNGVRDMYDFSHYIGEINVAQGGAQINVIRGMTPLAMFVFPTDPKAQGMSHRPARSIPSPYARSVGGSVAISPQWLALRVTQFWQPMPSELGLPTGTQGVVIDGVCRW